jgi:DNA-binding transcriptional regulator LsrR (DeoR family)
VSANIDRVRQLALDGLEVSVIARLLRLGRSTVREYLHRGRRRGVVAVANGPRCPICQLLEPHQCLFGDALRRPE